MRELLEQVVPSRALPRDADAVSVFAAMRAEWDALNIRAARNDKAAAGIVKLYRPGYPAHMFGPGEEKQAILRAQPKVDGRLERTPEGHLILRREGQMPLLVEQD